VANRSPPLLPNCSIYHLVEVVCSFVLLLLSLSLLFEPKWNKYLFLLVTPSVSDGAELVVQLQRRRSTDVYEMMLSVSVPTSVDDDQADQTTSSSVHVTLLTVGASTSFGSSIHKHIDTCSKLNPLITVRPQDTMSAAAIILFVNVFTARCYAERGYATVCPTMSYTLRI